MSGAKAALKWNQKGLEKAEQARTGATAQERRAAWGMALACWRRSLEEDVNLIPARLNRLQAQVVLGNAFTPVQEGHRLLEELIVGSRQASKGQSADLAWFPATSAKISGSQRYLYALSRWMAEYMGVAYRPEPLPYWRLAYSLHAADPDAHKVLALNLLLQNPLEGIHLLQQSGSSDPGTVGLLQLGRQRFPALTAAAKDEDPPLIPLPYGGESTLYLEPRMTAVTQVLLARGAWFEDEVEFCRHFLQPGMTMFDIGANVGLYALLAAQRVGPTGLVYAIEPTPSCQRCLRATVASNHLQDTLIPIEIALGDLPSRVYLVLNEDSVSNRIVTNLTGVTQDTHAIPLVRLDDLWQERGQPAVDLIKIDVGEDPIRVLRGARQVLTEGQPILIFEASGDGQVSATTSDFLSEKNYLLYSYNPHLNELLPARSTVRSHSSINLVAVPRSRLPELQARGLLSVLPDR